MKRCLLLMMALLLAVSQFGCLDAHSLDRYGYVLAIGFDEGETMPLRVTLLIQKTLTDSADSQKNGGFTLVDAECRDLFEAIDTLSASLPYQLDLARAMLIVVASKLAMRENGLHDVMDFSLTRLHIRNNVNLFLSLAKARDALEGFSNELDPSLSKIQLNFSAYSEATGLIPVTNITLLNESMDSGRYDAVVPLCGVTPDNVKEPFVRDSVGACDYAYVGGRLMTKGGMKTGLAGCALLKNGRMIGFLDGQNTQLLLMAKGEFTFGRMQLTLPDSTQLALQLHAQHPPSTTFTCSGGGLAALTVPLTAYVERPERLTHVDAATLERLLATELTTRLSALFSACQSLGTDALGMSKAAVKRFSSTAAWEAYDWESAYRSMRAAFYVKIEFAQDPQKSVLE